MLSEYDMSTADPPFNPLDPGHIRDPYPRLRDIAAVTTPMPGFRVVSSDAGARAVLRDTATFSSRANNTATENELEKTPALSQLDPPDHTRIRSLIQAQFTPRALSGLEPALRAHAHAHIDGLRDLVADFTEPLPALALAEFLGLPAELIRLWVSRFATLVGYESSPGWREFCEVIDAVTLRRFPELAVPDKRMLVHFLVVAGVRNVTHLLGNLLHRLLITQMWPLPADRIAAAVEESLRHEPPALWSMRTAMRPCAVDGVPIAAGERVFVLTAAANRDRARWPDPSDFRLDRPAAPAHLSFGAGPHACLGAAFTRLQAGIYVEVLADRTPELRLAEGTTYRPTGDLMSRGPATLPVRRSPCP